jgi:hypothetical protein
LRRGDSNCSNEGECPYRRGDNSKRVRMHLKFLKIFFSTTSRPISIKLCISHLWVKGILNCSNKGSGPLQREDNYKNAKIGWVISTSSPEPLSQNRSYLYESFLI